ncbi:MAG: hypothetical protein NT128_00235 [Proteobacteria bacterium]|nr:hypothetical protein [Pseudomonadota bacterium]
MSTEFIRSFRFLTLLVTLSMGINIGYSCEVENLKQTDIRHWVKSPPSEAEVSSFDWRTKNETGNTLIFDLNDKLVATIYTQKFDPYKGYFGIYFNVSGRPKISQEPFGDILSAKKWVISKAISHHITLKKGRR